MLAQRAARLAAHEAQSARSFFKASAAPDGDKVVDLAIVGSGMVGAGLARALGTPFPCP